MREQSTGATQIITAVENIRKQSDQTAKAMVEQARAGKEMVANAQNVAKQIAGITRANREHSVVSVNILKGLAEVRKVTDENAQGVQETRKATADLLERAEEFGRIMNRLGR